MWQEPDGAVVHVEAAGLEEAEVLAVAESVRPATRSDWKITHSSNENTGVAQPL